MLEHDPKKLAWEPIMMNRIFHKVTRSITGTQTIYQLIQ